MPFAACSSPYFRLVSFPTLVLAAASACGQPTGVSIAERFDTSAAGWSVYADGDAPAWIAVGGNPDGFIRVNDVGTGDYWGYLAPPAFTGDKSCYYGGVLSWDVRTNLTDTDGNSQPDVVLVGSGLTLVYDVPNPAVNTWTSFSVALTESAGWRVGTLQGPAPTLQQFRSVLSSLAALRLRGEFSSQLDVGGLDNVIMRGVRFDPGPQPALLCGNPVGGVHEVPFSAGLQGDGGPGVSVSWQFSVGADGPWHTLDAPVALGCGAGAQAAAVPATGVNTTIRFTRCASVNRYRVRAVLVSQCATLASMPAVIYYRPADMGGTGGVPGADGLYDNNDVIVFVDHFFAADAEADLGRAGGALGSDGAFDNNDFVSFIDLFFNAC